MSSTTIPVYICDRCGHREEIRESSAIYNWGLVSARQINGPFHIGKGHTDAKKDLDICPTCVGTLKSWWMVGKDANPSYPSPLKEGK